MISYDEAVSCYINSATECGGLPQPSECLSELHDDGCWALANVNGLLALVDEGGCVLRPQRRE
jgi:hypothetical protein